MTMLAWLMVTMLLVVGAFYVFLSMYALVNLAAQRIREKRKET